MIINRLNSTDRLTNLYNRTAFRGRVQEVLADPEMDPVHAIIYCDINDFSYINEKFGYPAGDRILKDFGSMFLRKGKRCFACRVDTELAICALCLSTRCRHVSSLASKRCFPCRVDTESVLCALCLSTRQRGEGNVFWIANAFVRDFFYICKKYEPNEN